MNEDQATDKTKKTGGLLAGGSVLTSLASLIGASCCVLPLVLVNLGLSGAFVAQLAVFARYRDYFMALALGLIAAALIRAFWRGRRPSRTVLIVLLASLAIVIGAYVMPSFEGQLVRALFNG